MKINKYLNYFVALVFLAGLFNPVSAPISLAAEQGTVNVNGSVGVASATSFAATDTGPGTGTAQLTWTPSPTPNVDTQRIFIAGPQGPGLYLTSIDIFNNVTTLLNVPNLLFDIEYTFTHTAIAGTLESVIIETTLTLASNLPAPVLNSEPSSTAGTSNVLSWTNGGLIDPTLECRITASTYDFNIDPLAPINGGDSGWIPCPNSVIIYDYTFTSLTLGETYYYQVQTQTVADGLSPYSNVESSQQVSGGGGGHGAADDDDDDPPPTPQFCSNSILDPGEECDDGNLISFDGCSNTCFIETITPPAQICGDSLAVAPEECDDGNLFDLDGCTNICLVEDTQPLADAAQAAADAAIAAAAAAGNADAILGTAESLLASTDSLANANDSQEAAGDTQAAADIHNTQDAIDTAVLAAQEAAAAAQTSADLAQDLINIMQIQADQAEQDYLDSIGTALEQEASDRADLAQSILTNVTFFADAAQDAADAAQAAADAVQIAADAISEFADVQDLINAINTLVIALSDTAGLVQDTVEAVEGIPALSELPLEACGNAIIEPPEECDDGNNENGDGCSDICELEEIVEVTLNIKGHPEFRVIYDNTPNLSLNNLIGVFKPSINNLDVLGTVLDSQGETNIDVMIVTGNYDFTLNGDAHNTRIIRNIDITSTTTEVNLDFTFADTVKLVAGDTFDDNYINAQDIATMIGSYKQGSKTSDRSLNLPGFSESVVQKNYVSDLNKDGDPIVNAQDIAILIWNYKKEGDYL